MTSTNPVKVAGVVIRKDNKCLLVQEGVGRAKGLWNLPAGHVDPGETLEEAAVREAFEETGYRVRVTKPLVQAYDAKTERNSFAAEVVGGELRPPEGEIAEARWVSLEQAQALGTAIRHPWVIRSIQAAIATKK